MMLIIPTGISERIERTVNVVNHAFIGFIVIYMTWYCINGELTTMNLHAWLCILGYQLLLAEGVMCLYSNNPLTSSFSARTQRILHWTIQMIGSSLGLAGAFVMIANVKGKNFQSIHGILGLTSCILLLINFLSGLLAFFSVKFKNYVQPIGLKVIHIVLGVCGFVIGMVALYYGFEKLTRHLDVSFVKLLQVISLITVVLTCFGAIKSLYQYLKTFLTV